ncbi:nephrin [Caerostris extrusa]|uniref:Nephrin n=1 Tax=Caerostris extrusa TaxID=172846 RepID=A0AAV4QDS8_CAEEX|nr:nephrin [Caerostris extrusa]
MHNSLFNCCPSSSSGHADVHLCEQQPLSRISWTRNGAFVRDHREETQGSVYGGIATKSKMSLLVTSSDDKSQFTCLAKSDEFKTAVTDSLTLRIRRKCSNRPIHLCHPLIGCCNWILIPGLVGFPKYKCTSMVCHMVWEKYVRLVQKL